jgi:hypothetical protein
LVSERAAYDYTGRTGRDGSAAAAKPRRELAIDALAEQRRIGTVDAGSAAVTIYKRSPWIPGRL